MNRPCPTCGWKASLRKQIVSTTTFLGFILIATYFIQSPIAILQGIVVFVFFLLVIIIDIEHHLILHAVSIVGAIGLGVIGYFKHGLMNTLLGGVAGFVMMYILYLIGVWFGRLLSKKRGTMVEEGLGFGDVTLATVCGLLIGWPGIIASLFFGILLGGMVSIVIIGISLVRKQYTPFLAIPYGPFLAIAAFTLWITSLP
jgi:prepilin signal peptidase PulO-like enzyme (type II secretory pathway)